MKKYQYLASWDDQTLTRVGEPVVVLGDSNVSQVEVTLPSNFLLDPTKAECRMYFLLPGEKESAHDVLETAVKDENGDSHVTWTIKHVHSQKGGRLAFSLTLIGDNVQWDSRTAIIPVYESRYQPESEEAEEPYTGRLTALEGSMASIRGEFAEVQEDFKDLKETATLGTPIPESLVANMTEGHVYIYTGTETGYTAGHVYYYVNGALTDGGVYGGTAVDTTLTESGKAADAAAVGAEVSAIKEDLSAVDDDLTIKTPIIESVTTNSYRLQLTGLAKSDSNYKLLKYQVTSGDSLVVVSDHMFQFQTSQSVPSSGQPTRVGITYETGNYKVIVPETATYLIVSTTVSDSTAEVYVLSNKLNKIESDVSAVYNSAYENDLIELVANEYIKLSGTKVTLRKGVPASSGSSSTYSYGIKDCKEDDVFIVSGEGGNDTRLWSFVSADGTIISVASSNAREDNLVLTAPENTRWFIGNTKSGGSFYQHKKVNDYVVRYDALQNKPKNERALAQKNIGVTDIVSSYAIRDALLNCLSHVAWTNDDGQKYYDALDIALHGVLPNAYTRVSYIIADRNDATQYIDTGIYVPDDYDSVVMEATLKFGAMLDQNGFGINEFATITSGSNYYRINGELTDLRSGLQIDKIKLQCYNDSNALNWIFSLNENQISGIRSNPNTAISLTLFALKGTNDKTVQKHMNGALMKDFKLVINGIIISDMVAVVRKIDGIAGMYDFATEKFFPSSGSENFGYVGLGDE